MKGCSHKEAKVALARRIAAISLSLLKNNETYHDDYQERLKKRKELRKCLTEYN